MEEKEFLSVEETIHEEELTYQLCTAYISNNLTIQNKHWTSTQR